MNDVQIAIACEALSAKHKRDLADPSYNRLNVVQWHALAGHLSNRITDFEAYYEPIRKLTKQIRRVACRSGNAKELTSLLKRLEALEPEANKYLREIRKVSVAMDEELEWYTDETNQVAWDAAGVSPY